MVFLNQMGGLAHFTSKKPTRGVIYVLAYCGLGLLFRAEQ